MHLKVYHVALFLFVLLNCKGQNKPLAYESGTLKIAQVTNNTYRHISYLETDDFGKFGCNGMLIVNGGEALIFDTPTNNSESKELIDWIEQTLNCKVVGIVLTHFHEDCLGGLEEFHERQIPSYASFKTIELARKDSVQVPKIGFEEQLEITVGTKKVINEFFGEGHTKDNIVSYFPSENVLFGGCLVKTLKAGKGYLGDANVKEWSNTVQAVNAKYDKVKVVIPGHGKPGDSNLLDYTIQLFEVE